MQKSGAAVACCENTGRYSVVVFAGLRLDFLWLVIGAQCFLSSSVFHKWITDRMLSSALLLTHKNY